ncbi:ankyrin repeat-containing domain protein [Rhizophagus irregularis DAOM 181602=DAOM 197198]|nr:ankyrin repeat-containing domain protein [Rhizophagus irregularis DAOM 181602=DAOM 197198]
MLIVHIILPQNYDINLFIYGLDEEAAKKKMEEIYENVCKAIPWEVTCIRSKHCVTIISQYLAYSMLGQCNVIDLTRRSPSYEMISKAHSLECSELTLQYMREVSKNLSVSLVYSY